MHCITCATLQLPGHCQRESTDVSCRCSLCMKATWYQHQQCGLSTTLFLACSVIVSLLAITSTTLCNCCRAFKEVTCMQVSHRPLKPCTLYLYSRQRHCMHCIFLIMQSVSQYLRHPSESQSHIEIPYPLRHALVCHISVAVPQSRGYWHSHH